MSEPDGTRIDIGRPTSQRGRSAWSLIAIPALAGVLGYAWMEVEGGGMPPLSEVASTAATIGREAETAAVLEPLPAAQTVALAPAAPPPETAAPVEEPLASAPPAQVLPTPIPDEPGTSDVASSCKAAITQTLQAVSASAGATGGAVWADHRDRINGAAQRGMQCPEVTLELTGDPQVLETGGAELHVVWNATAGTLRMVTVDEGMTAPAADGGMVVVLR